MSDRKRVMAGSSPKHCFFCGTPNDDDAVFCGACGRAISGPTAVPRPAQVMPPADLAGGRTMMGVPMPPLGAAPPGDEPTRPSGHELGSAALGGPTIIDGPRVDLEALAAAVRLPPQSLGAARAGQRPAEPAWNARGMTVLGLPTAPAGQPGPGPGEPRGAERAPRERAPQPAPPDQGGLTMLGLPAPPAAQERRAAPAAGPAPGRPPEDAGLTMLGVPAPAVRKSEPPPAAASRRPDARSDERRSLEADPPGARSRAGLLVGLGVLLAALVLGAGVLLLALGLGVDLGSVLLARQAGPVVTPEVAAAGDVLRVTLALEPAPEGGRVRFAGQEQAIAEGRASFEVPASTIEVGDNVLGLQVVDRGGGTTDHEIRVHLSHRAVADLSGLSGSPPAYAVRFQVAGGAGLTVSGRPVGLDGERSYTHRVLLADALAGAVDAGEAVVHRVPFAVRTDSGEVFGGSVDTSIPRTRLRVDRPAEGSPTDRESVAVAGIAEAEAAVTVGGRAVEAQGGRFVALAPLSQVGENVVEVTASAPGKAPRTVRLVVLRVDDLRPLVEEYAASVDPGLDVGTLRRDPEAARGRVVRYEGRVVAVETARGQTLMQLLVRSGCSGSEPCFVYVTHDGLSDASAQSNVTVYGVVTGTRDLPTQSGGRLSMPSVDARFVVVEAGRQR